MRGDEPKTIIGVIALEPVMVFDGPNLVYYPSDNPVIIKRKSIKRGIK